VSSSLESTQTYDNEDKMLTVKYPDTQYYGNDGLATTAGPEKRLFTISSMLLAWRLATLAPEKGTNL
jgi:hypothetical protein